MTPPVTRATAGGRAYLALQAQARRDKRPTSELFVLYILESFLRRLAGSEHREHLVLKGGVLLAALGTAAPPGTSTSKASRSPTRQLTSPASSAASRPCPPTTASCST